MTIQAMLAQNCLSFCMQQAGEQVSLKGTLHPTQTKQRKPHNAKAQLNDVYSKRKEKNRHTCISAESDELLDPIW